MIARAKSNARFRPRLRVGSALLLVVIVVATLTLATFSFSRLMLSEYRGARSYGRALQSLALAESGIEFLKQCLAQDEQYLREEFGGLYQNPTRFRAVTVIDAPTPDERGRFTVVAPDMANGTWQGHRYGLEDESAKINLHLLMAVDKQSDQSARNLLLNLPGMTEDLADAILDWIDADSSPRQFGAEADYYSGLDPPYAPRNAIPETIEELLLVRGMTPELLFGPDANRNGVVDAAEGDGMSVGGADNSMGELNRGLAAYFTPYSQERNLRPDGQPKIDLNQDDLENLQGELQPLLGEEMTNFIIAYRIYGPAQDGAQGAAFTGQLDLSQSPTATLTTVLDLIGVDVQIPGQNQNENQILMSPFLEETSATYLPLLMENVAVSAAPSIPGRININQAPYAVLRSIPGMTEGVAQEIVNARVPEATPDQADRRYETWIFSQDIVTLDEMKALMPYVTGGGSVFRAQVVGFFDQRGPAARLEVVLDATTAPVRIVSWRDIGRLGRGYALETLGLQTAE